jgi:nitronate monooxygenase
MLRTFLTERWGLRYPLIGAPMAGVAFGELAHAVTRAGGFGMIGIGSTDTVAFIAEQSAIAGREGTRFGIGLMVWAVERRPELLDAALAAKPFAISLSFGDVGPYVARLREAGVGLATQVNTREDALAAERAGAELIVVQGTEAGGHTDQIATLPLLQIVLESVRVPVVAAGGIASARGLAAVLAAGAQGAWIGTALLASPEGHNTPAARARVIAARENETVHTHLFDRLTNVPWPDRYPGRALANDYTRRWHGHEDEALGDAEVVRGFAAARAAADYDKTYIYAGQAVGLLERERAVAEVIADIGDGAERLLRERSKELLG